MPHRSQEDEIFRHPGMQALPPAGIQPMRGPGERGFDASQQRVEIRRTGVAVTESEAHGVPEDGIARDIEAPPG